MLTIGFGTVFLIFAVGVLSGALGMFWIYRKVEDFFMKGIVK